MPPWARLSVSVSNPRRVGLITLSHAVNEFYSVAIPPIIPLLVADLHLSYAEAGGLLTVFYLMYSLFQIPAGRLADRVGQKRLLVSGMVCMATGMLLASVAGGYPTLVAAQVISGIGGSTHHPSGMSLISDLESGETEGKAMGIHGFGGVSGMAAAPVVVGGLAVAYDWRVAVAGSAAVGLGYAAVFGLLFTRPTDAGNPSEPPDAADDGRSANTRARDGGSEQWRATLLRAVNVPLTWWYAGLCAIQFLLGFELGALRTFAPAYLFERLSGSPGLANTVYFLMLVGGGTASLAGGYVADLIDRRVLGFAGFLGSAVGLAGMPFIDADGAVLFGWFFLLGVAVFAAGPAKNALASGYSRRGFSGSLFGVMMTAGAIGTAAGSFLFGVLAESIGVRTAFPLIAVVGVLGAATFLSMFYA